MKKKRRKKEFIFKFFGSSSFLSLFLFFTTTETPNRISLISFFLSLSLLYSAHFYVFCGVSSITDDELVFVKKKVFYATHIRKRERDGRGL